MAGRRTLIVHAGGGKAGSSAIQSALGQAADALAAVGIAYTHAPPAQSAYEITSGNGFELYEQVARDGWEESGEALIESYLADKQIGICSSEFLGSLPEEHWRRLIDTADACGVDVRVVYFVRSAAGYVVASYNQDVKRAGEHRPLVDFAKGAGWQHLLDLRKLHDLFDGARLKVINYDLARRDIIGALIAAVPELEPAEASVRINGHLTVNRSLTAAEVEVMRHVNARIGGRLSAEISDRLIYDDPELRAPVHLDHETIRILSGKFEDATSWVNVTFLPDAENALRFLPEVTDADGQSVDNPERVLRIVLDWAIDRIAAGSEDITSLRETLLAIDWHNSAHPLIPHDFDPVAYLLINSDVLRARNPPYDHYIGSGHREKRAYRWPLNLDSAGDHQIAETLARLRLEESEQEANSPLWPRLRRALQLEALLHQFANRERDYLDEIRKLHEGQGFENERFRQRLSEVVEPVRSTVQATREELIRQGDQQISKLAHQLQPLQASLEASIQTVRNDLLQQDEQKMREVESSLAKLAETLTTQISTLKDDQARLNAALELKDAELNAQAGQLRSYRESGFLKFMRWAVQPGDRP